MRRRWTHLAIAGVFALMGLGGLIHWTARGAALAAPRATPPPPDGAPLGPASWYENDTQGVRQTWQQYAITGTGVRLAVLDSGIDFANPALAGRYAVQPDTGVGSGAYVGWPIAFDAGSLAQYAAAPDRAFADGNWGWLVNASHVVAGSGAFTFTHPLDESRVYTVPDASQSGTYHLGLHPDSALDDAPLLVADEADAGVYDTVYVDLDDDGTFETSMHQDQPVGALDATGDGVADISAGMLYWIADGLNPPPGTVAKEAALPTPEAGTVLALMLDTHGHGTMCAATAAGNDGGVFTATDEVASFYDPATYGPLVQGPAPGAALIAMGNVYAGGDEADWYRFSLLGYDGQPGTGDEPQIVTLSFGSGGGDRDTWDWESRHLTHLNLKHGADSPLFVQSAGNGGFGYGTLIPPKAPTALIVGASTQYGTVNVWGVSETVSLAEGVNTGDVSAFSARGPGADGTRAVDLVANGMAGTGAYPLNSPYISEGATAYVHWKGTSRSAPVVGGMAALVYQAFEQAEGRFPTYAEARGLLINAARDLGYDPLVQGAGQADVLRAVELALGQEGVTIDPPVAVAGDYRGARYPAFASGLARGEVQTLTFTATNPTAEPVTLDLRARRLAEIARYTHTLTTRHDVHTNYGKGAPDYALELTDWVSRHRSADLMVVRISVPFTHFDTRPPSPPTVSNTWRLMVYNWWDDGDGVWWMDTNTDGRIDWPGELDGGDEWLRFDHSHVTGPQQEVRVGRPYTRSLGAGSGGIWAGATRDVTTTVDNATALAFEVTFYRAELWSVVTLSARQPPIPAGGQGMVQEMEIPANGQRTFQATVALPTDAPYGLHQGKLLVGEGEGASVIPLTFQVWADPAAGATLGGGERAGRPHDIGRIGGGFNWYPHSAYEESGDWRFFGFDVVDPPVGSAVVARTLWDEASRPTDLDTLLLGPAADAFSRGAPGLFGPHTLAVAARSERPGTPPYLDFQTVTGGAEEWVAAPARDGLHVLAEHAVLFAGGSARQPFTASLGLVAVDPAPLSVDPAACAGGCTVEATLRSALDLPQGVTATYALGWVTPTVFSDQTVAPGAVATHTLALAEPIYRLEATLMNASGLNDLDLALVDDGGQSVATAAWPGSDERLLARDLSAGSYYLRVESRAVAPEATAYDLRVVAMPVAADGALGVEKVPDAVAAGEPVTLTLRVDEGPSGGQEGLLVLGPELVPEALEIPVVAQHRVYLPLALRSY